MSDSPPSASSDAPAPIENVGVGLLPDLVERDLPERGSLLAVIGPGVVWMALAQGSGELIWWPWAVSKYGLALMFLLVPACLLQYPLNYQIGRYTLLTGESVFQGLIRLNRWLALVLYLMMTVSFFWLGAFVKVSGQGIVEITNFPPENAAWWPMSASAFWAQAFMVVFLFALLLSRRVYVLIERVMFVVAIVTVLGFAAACVQPGVRPHIPAFFQSLFTYDWPDDFDTAADASGLLGAITFAGLGGFWTLFYSYWLREKGAGMSAHMGHITSPITGKRETIPASGFRFADTADNTRRWNQWKRFFLIDNGIGVFGNLLTTLMTCLLAYVFLFQKGVVVEGDQLIHAQAGFFQDLFPQWGRLIFLLVATAFLADTWLATVDSVSRLHADFIQSYVPAARRVPYRTLYYLFVILGFALSTGTLYFEPYDAILLMVQIGFAGTVIYSISLVVLNYRVVPKLVAPSARPGKLSLLAILVSCTCYAALAIVYLMVRLGG
jgi:Mn2+/Fe2+ NRAMP family transporter